ncbi:unnamed protein product [Didymodactylos carnosus]|uniref:Uncharacterized protein n=1 Tax=Didymodactylos carnosus TaxID=1234261 RepID=A0A813YLM2_9BILA|nr:unnamed protein product [Didymodactylos carnosus]CAF3671571.1 unnamed protein product [Didymodactylos carnosus]
MPCLRVDMQGSAEVFTLNLCLCRTKACFANLQRRASSGSTLNADATISYNTGCDSNCQAQFTNTTRTIPVTIVDSTGTQQSTTLTYNGATDTTQVGEGPPTKSAQIGLGIGITFSALIIVGEIAFFTFYYRNPVSRSTDYHMN